MKLIAVVLFSLASITEAVGAGAIAYRTSDVTHYAISVDQDTRYAATIEAVRACGQDCTIWFSFRGGCLTTGLDTKTPATLFFQRSQPTTSQAAEEVIRRRCMVPNGGNPATCQGAQTRCDSRSSAEEFQQPYQEGDLAGTIRSIAQAAPLQRPAVPDITPPPTSPAGPPIVFVNTISPETTLDALLFGAGLIITLLIFLFCRKAIANYIVHGNLPRTLPVYGEDILVLVKRTQRVNWYGRVVFGLVTNLAMTHQQLIDIRKYWLGRVVAFDSLRRLRQNELARMHLQLAATAKSEAKEQKPLSQLLAALKTILLIFFYLIRALFSFLFGFFFIRVTIAKLVRGTIVESKDLTLILQAKEAIEESATYLKEYLETANTFDGRDEVV
jgi:hypothetical protein